MTSKPRFEVGVLGLGALGARVARQLGSCGVAVAVFDERQALVDRLAPASGERVSAAPASVVLESQVVVVATPSPHRETMRLVDYNGGIGVSSSDDPSDVAEMLSDDLRAAVGVGFAPGLSGLLARVLSAHLDRCDEIHIAMHGTGGPACARQHHRALAGWAAGWHEGEWISRPSGSGRELCWFPEPVGPRDCYRAEMPDPMLIHRAFPTVERISARISATRRDRLTARLPMLRPPHVEGGVGGLRVEARGEVGGERRTLVAGVAERVAVGAAAMVSALVTAVLDGLIVIDHPVTTADSGLPAALLIERVRALGLTLNEYVGGESVPTW
jgi:NAD binding domain of 6-phosphogluconate dehydrogenase